MSVDSFRGPVDLPNEREGPSPTGDSPCSGVPHRDVLSLDIRYLFSGSNRVDIGSNVVIS